MKKSFFYCAVLSALAALAGCQKTESAMGLGDNDAIGFAPYVSRGAASNTGGVAKAAYTVPDAATEDFIVASGSPSPQRQV